MKNRYLVAGWAEAFFTVLVLWGINNVVLGYSAKVLEANIIVYACSAFSSSALMLLLIGGRGPLARETMRSVDTWAYGFILLMNYIISLNLFALVTSTEGSLIQRFSLIFSLLASWFFLARKPSRGQLFGALAIFAGIVLVCADIPTDKRAQIYGLIFVSGVFQAARVFVAEFHRPHAQAAKGDEGVRGRCRVIGFVMFVISALFWLVMFGLAAAQGNAEQSQLMPGLPVLADFFHTPSILFGMASGALLVAPIRLLEFSSTQTIKTENFLAVTSLSSISTWFWEWATRPLTGLSLKELSGLDLWGGILITFGGFWMAASMMRRHASSRSRVENFIMHETQDLSVVEDSREIVANTLEHFKGNINRAAEALDVPVKVLDMIIADHEQVIGFRPEVLKNIARRYRKKVAASDALTGLLNRAAFMAALKTATADKAKCTVLYIDLDKFKPVNDTYGHDAGDAVLQEVAVRLQNLLPPKGIASRLGGDEFALLLPQTDKKAAIALGKKLEEVMARPMVVTAERYLVTIGASFGVATSPQDGTDGEALLAAADKGMYGVKKGR